MTLVRISAVIVLVLVLVQSCSLRQLKRLLVGKLTRELVLFRSLATRLGIIKSSCEFLL